MPVFPSPTQEDTAEETLGSVSRLEVALENASSQATNQEAGVPNRFSWAAFSPECQPDLSSLREHGISQLLANGALDKTKQNKTVRLQELM